MKSEQEIQRLASRLLQSYGIAGPPVDVVGLARKLGIQIRSESADMELSGALYRLPDRIVIGVNKNHPIARRRFTIAHEIGHLILHDQPVFIDRSYPAATMHGEELRFRRDSVSSQAIDSKEVEANRFAAALLMPASNLISDANGFKLPLASDSVQTLAKHYQVSSQAMMYRLMKLGISIEQV